MAVTLFVFPLTPGKKQQYFNFMNECITTKKKEFKDMLLRYGCNNLNMWSHQIDGKDYAMFTHDLSDDAFDRMAKWNESTNSFDKWFDKWFDKHLRECYDIDFENQPTHPTFFGKLD